MVMDVVPGNGDPGNTLGYFTPVGSTLYFASLEPGQSTSRMWKTDGTAAGTAVLRIPGTNTSPHTVRLATAVGDSVFYVAQDNVGQALWKANASTGVALVKRFTAFSDIGNAVAAETSSSSPPRRRLAPGNPTEPTPAPFGPRPVARCRVGGRDRGGVGQRRIFEASRPVAFSLMAPYGTVKIDNVRPFSNPCIRVVSRPALLEDSTGALYRTDGTQAGTVGIKQFYFGLSRMTAAPGGVYFVGYDGVQGPYWWFSSGTPEGTVLIESFPQYGIAGSDAPEVTASLPTGLLFATWANRSGFEPFIIPIDTTPDAVSFAPRAPVLTNSRVESVPVPVLGINGLVPVSVTGGEVCISSQAVTCTCDLVPWAYNAVSFGQLICVSSSRDSFHDGDLFGRGWWSSGHFSRQRARPTRHDPVRRSSTRWTSSAP
jgi:ELWxxDGT repeat protein